MCTFNKNLRNLFQPPEMSKQLFGIFPRMVTVPVIMADP